MSPLYTGMVLHQLPSFMAGLLVNNACTLLMVHNGDGTKPGLWTHGLDRGLDYGLDHGPKIESILGM